TSRLADAGARVIKIEREDGDFARLYDRAVGDLSSYFVWLNRGKESLVADIKDHDDAALLHTILAKADIFIQNLAPGAAARSGFDSAALRERYPRLITVDISGYGQSGEYAGMKAYDLLVQAETGLAMITGRPEGPGRVGISVCDIGCGMYAYAAVLEALLDRARTGRGKGLEVSLFDGIADWMSIPLLQYESTGESSPRLGLAHPTICPYGAFATRDGDLLLISIQNEREWQVFCTHFLEEPELPRRAGFESNVARVANRLEVDAHVAAAFARFTRAEATERLRLANTAFGAVNDVAGLSRHPALRRVPVMTAHGVAHVAAPPAIQSDGEPALGRVPEIGEHTVAIRNEFGKST
ncbi:MAG: CaiB/BaiF CoA-transferase family protein, partial [Betaproteobacteria bacterium]